MLPKLQDALIRHLVKENLEVVALVRRIAAGPWKSIPCLRDNGGGQDHIFKSSDLHGSDSLHKEFLPKMTSFLNLSILPWALKWHDLLFNTKLLQVFAEGSKVLLATVNLQGLWQTCP